ncbi:MAG: manganese efflux pump MntP family protein [Elusimicrobiota bacterium]
MNYLEIFLIALSLSLDAFAVSISSGGTMKFLRISQWFKMAFFFGAFQALMPLIGWLAGISMLKYISSLDHWVAFILLFAVGAKMIYEGFKIEDMNCEKKGSCPFNTMTLLILSLATSIDALAVGITFSLIKISIISPIIIIGIVTFLMSLSGVKIGYAGKNFFENKMEIIAGCILIILGFKILIQHMI